MPDANRFEEDALLSLQKSSVVLNVNDFQGGGFFVATRWCNSSLVLEIDALKIRL